MFNKKAKRITELAKQVRALEDKAYYAQRDMQNAYDTRDRYRELYIELERTRPRTLEEQLVEARRINQELNDKKTLTWLLEQNCKLTKENK